MKKTEAISILIILFFSIGLFAQNHNELGIPFIRNFSADDFGGNPQTWVAIQDKRGVMYFGNGDGIVQYDGTNWETIPLPFYSMVRSLDMDNNGRIYMGAVNELGYLKPDSASKMKYISLVYQKKNKKLYLTDLQKLKMIKQKYIAVQV